MSRGDGAAGTWEVLDGLGPSRPMAQRDAACRALLDRLGRIAQGVFVGARRAGEPTSTWRIPRERQEDVVYEVAASVVRKSPLSIVGETRDDLDRRDRRCDGYLRVMLRNRWLDELRAAPAVDAVDIEVVGAPAPSSDEETIEVYLPMFERVLDAALAARPAQYRSDLRKTWLQTWTLVTHARSMATTLAEDEGAPPGDVVAARNRVYKRSQRLREYMLEAACKLRDAGALLPADYRVVEAFITGVMVRCQTPPRARVSHQHDPSKPSSV